MTRRHAPMVVVVGAALCLVASSATAAAALDVRDAWVRATVPGQSVAAAYMTLRSQRAVRVVAIRSNASRAAAIHSMSLENGVMRMRPLETVAVAPGHAIVLAPGGLHIMLSGLQRPLATGETVELELTTEDDSGTKASIRVQAPVRQEAPR